jgi:hypothetical protein
MTTYYRYNGVDYADDDDLPLTLYTKHTRPLLPTDLILRIIRGADGGRNAHKKKFSPTLDDITKLKASVDGGANRVGEVQFTTGEQFIHLIKIQNHEIQYRKKHRLTLDWDGTPLPPPKFDYEGYFMWCVGEAEYEDFPYLDERYTNDNLP